MTFHFLPKTSGPPGSASASPPRDDSRSSSQALNAAQPQPLETVAPPVTSPLVPRQVPIPQPAVSVIRDVYLRRRRVEEITGLKTPTLYRYMKQGLFPRPHKLGPNTVGWSTSAVLAWFNSRAST